MRSSNFLSTRAQVFGVLFSMAFALYSTTSFAHDATFDEHFDGVTPAMTSEMLGCKDKNYELCNIFGSAVIQVGNEKNRPQLADIAKPYFLMACDNGVMWGCANLGLMYKLGTPEMHPDLGKAKLYYKEACEGAGDESKKISIACTWWHEIDSAG